MDYPKSILLLSGASIHGRWWYLVAMAVPARVRPEQTLAAQPAVQPSLRMLRATCDLLLRFDDLPLKPNPEAGFASPGPVWRPFLETFIGKASAGNAGNAQVNAYR